MLATMPSPGTQYLQVPKMLPHRKARSRSRSRPQDVCAPQEVPSPSEVVVSPIKLRFQHHSPPSTPLEPVPVRPWSPAQIASPPSPSSVPAKPTSQTSTARNRDHTPPILVPSPPASIAIEDLHHAAKIPLRQRLIGTWKLESYIAYPTPSSTIQRPTFPMTKNVTGFIMYTPDGYMAAQMLIPGQKSFKRGEGQEPQWAEAGKRCFAYCGPYYITDEGLEEGETLRHTFQCCNLPGWVGDIQVRTHRFEEDGEVLVLGSEEPTEIKGDERNPVLRWRRARDNSFGTPPPPMPQIEISGPGDP